MHAIFDYQLWILEGPQRKEEASCLVLYWRASRLAILALFLTVGCADRTRSLGPSLTFACASDIFPAKGSMLTKDGAQLTGEQSGLIRIRIIDHATFNACKANHVVTFAPGDPCTLLYALYKHGGLSESADPRRLRIIRNFSSHEDASFDVDVRKLLNDGDTGDDVPLKQGDTILIFLKARLIAH